MKTSATYSAGINRIESTSANQSAITNQVSQSSGVAAGSGLLGGVGGVSSYVAMMNPYSQHPGAGHVHAGGRMHAALGLAHVGTRAALSFAFAFLRRAWRNGDDLDLCTELLQVGQNVLFL